MSEGGDYNQDCDSCYSASIKCFITLHQHQPVTLELSEKYTITHTHRHTHTQVVDKPHGSAHQVSGALVD